MLQPHPRGTKGAQQNAAPGLSGLSSGALGLSGAAGLGSTGPFLPPPSRHHNGVSHASSQPHAAAASSSSLPAQAAHAHGGLRAVGTAAAVGLPGSGGAFVPSYASSLYAGHHAGAASTAKGSRHMHGHAMGAASVGNHLATPLQAGAAYAVHPALELLELQKNAQMAAKQTGAPPDAGLVIVGVHHLVHPAPDEDAPLASGSLSPQRDAGEDFVDVLEFPDHAVSLRHVLLLGPGEKIHPNVDFEGQSDPAPADCEIRAFARVLPVVSEYTATARKGRPTAQYRLLQPNEAVAAEAEARAAQAAEGAKPIPWTVLEIERTGARSEAETDADDVAVDQIIVCGKYRTLSVVLFGHVLDGSTSKASYIADINARVGRPAASPSFVDVPAPVAGLARRPSRLASPLAPGASSAALPVLLGLHGLPGERAVAAGALLNALVKSALLGPIGENLEAWLSEAKAASKKADARREDADSGELGSKEKRHEKREEDGLHGGCGGAPETPGTGDAQGGSESPVEGTLKRKRQTGSEGVQAREEREGADEAADPKGRGAAPNSDAGNACSEEDVLMGDGDDQGERGRTEEKAADSRRARDEEMDAADSDPRDRERDGDCLSVDQESEMADAKKGETKRDERGPRGTEDEKGKGAGASASDASDTQRAGESPSAQSGTVSESQRADQSGDATSRLCNEEPSDDGIGAPSVRAGTVVLQKHREDGGGYSTPRNRSGAETKRGGCPWPSSLAVDIPSAPFWVESLQLVSRLFSGFVSSPDVPLASAFAPALCAAGPFSPELLLLLAASSCGALEALVLGPKAREARRLALARGRGPRWGEARQGEMGVGEKTAVLETADEEGLKETGARSGTEKQLKEAGDGFSENRLSETSCAGGDAADIAAKLLGLDGRVRCALAEARATWEARAAGGRRGRSGAKSEPVRGDALPLEEGRAPGEMKHEAKRRTEERLDDPEASPRKVFFSDAQVKEEEVNNASTACETVASGARSSAAAGAPASLFVSFLCPSSAAGGAGAVGGNSLLLLVLKLLRRLALLRETARLLVAEGAVELLMSILVESPILPGRCGQGRRPAERTENGEREKRDADLAKEAGQEKIAARGWRVRVEALKSLLVLVSHVEGMERFLGWDRGETGEASDLAPSSSPPVPEGAGTGEAGDLKQEEEEKQASLYSRFLQALASHLSFSRYHLKRLAAVLLSRVKAYYLLASLQQVTVSLLRPSPSASSSSSCSSFLSSLSFAGPRTHSDGLGATGPGDAHLLRLLCRERGATSTVQQFLLDKGDSWVSVAADTIEAVNLQLLHQTLPASAIAASRDERAEVELSWPLTPSRPWSAAALVVCSRPSLPLHLQRFLQARLAVASFAVLAQCLYTRLSLVLCPSTADLRLFSSLRSVLLLFLRATNGALFLASNVDATQALLFHLEATGHALLSRCALLPDPLNSEDQPLSLSLKQHLLALATPLTSHPPHRPLSALGFALGPARLAFTSPAARSPLECMRALLAACRGGEDLEAAAGPLDWLSFLGPAEQGFIEGLLPTKKEEEAAVMAMHVATSTRLHLAALALLDRFLETPLFTSWRKPQTSGKGAGEMRIDVDTLAALESMAGTPGGRQAVAAAFRLRHADVFLAMLLVDTVALLTEDPRGDKSEAASPLSRGPGSGPCRASSGSGGSAWNASASLLRSSGLSVELLAGLRSLALLAWQLVVEDDYASFLLPCGPLLLVALRPLALLSAEVSGDEEQEDGRPLAATGGAEDGRPGAAENRKNRQEDGRGETEDESFGALAGQAQASSFVKVETHCGLETLLRGDRELRLKIVSLYEALLPLYVSSDQTAASLPSPSSLLMSTAPLPSPPSPRALVDSIRCLDAPCALRVLQAAAASGAGPAGPGAPVGRLGSSTAPVAGAAGPGAGTGPNAGPGGRASPAVVFGGIDGGQGIELIDVAWGTEVTAAPCASKKGQTVPATSAPGTPEAWEVEGDTPPQVAPLSALLAARLLTLYVRRCPHVLLFAGPEEIEYFLSSEDGQDAAVGPASGKDARDDGTQFLAKLAVEDDGDEDVAAWGSDRLDRDGLGPIERSLLAVLKQRTQAPEAESAEEASGCVKESLYARVGLANGVPTHPGLGLFLLSADGQKALVSCLARCVALLEPPAGNLATMADWQVQGPSMHAWLQARQQTLPLVRALLMLLYNVLHGLTRPVADEEDTAGYRNLDLLQLLLLLTARLFAMGDWVGGAAWEAEARAVAAGGEWGPNQPSGATHAKRRGRGGGSRSLAEQQLDAENLALPRDDVGARVEESAKCSAGQAASHVPFPRLLPPFFFPPLSPSPDANSPAGPSASDAGAAARTARWLTGVEALGHGDTCLQVRLCLAWCCRLFFLWFQNFRESQAFLVKHLIRFGAAALPSLQQASLLLLTSLASFASILPAAPHSFHLLPSPRRPPICGGGVTPLELAGAAAEAKRDREKVADSRNKRGNACQLSATVAAMLPPTVTLSARVLSLLDMCALDWRVEPEKAEGAEEDSDRSGAKAGKGLCGAILGGGRGGKPDPESRPLYFCCEIDLTDEIAAAVSSSSSSLGAAAVFGCLSMGDEGIVPMEDCGTAGKTRPGDDEDEDIADVYRLLKETLWGGSAAPAGPEDEKDGAAPDDDDDKNEVSSLRRWMRENEAIRVEELVVLVSVVTRAAVSSSAALHSLGAHAAAQLAAHRFPVYSLLFECMDTLLDSVLLQFAQDEERRRSAEGREKTSKTQPTAAEEPEGESNRDGEDAELDSGDAGANGDSGEVFAFVPSSRALEAARCLCRLLLFIEHLVALQAKASSTALPELERLVALPSTRLLQVCLALLSSSALLAAAGETGDSLAAARATSSGKSEKLGGQDASAGVNGESRQSRSVKAVSQALLRCAIRLATNIVVSYQRLVDSAREVVESREAFPAYQENEQKAVEVPNHLAVIRKIAEAVCLLCNRDDAHALGLQTLGLALGFLVTLGAHPFTLLTASFDLPQHSTEAVLMPLRAGQAELTAVAAGANSALQLGGLLGKIVGHTRTAAQHPEDRSSHLWLGLADRLLLLVNLLLTHAAHPVAPLFALLQPGNQAGSCPWDLAPETEAREGGRGDEVVDDLDIYADLQPAETRPRSETEDGRAQDTSRSPCRAQAGKLEPKEDPRTALLRPLHSALETLLSQCQLFLAAQASRASHAKKLGEERLRLADLEKSKRMRLLAQQAVALLAKTEETEKRIFMIKLEPPPLLLEGAAFLSVTSSRFPGLRECLFWGGEDAFLWDIVAHCDVGFNISVRRANSLTDPLLPVPAAQPVRDHSLRLVLDAALAARALESSEDWWSAVSLEAIACEGQSPAPLAGAAQAAGDATAVGGSGAREAGGSAGASEDGRERKGAQDSDAAQLPAWLSDPLVRFHQAVSVPAPVDCASGSLPPPAAPGRAPGYGATAQGAFPSATAGAAGGTGPGRGVVAQGAGTGRSHEGPAADPFRSRTKSSSRAPSKHVDDYEAAVPGGLTFQKKPAAIPPPPPPDVSAVPSREVSPQGEDGSAGQGPALAAGAVPQPGAGASPPTGGAGAQGSQAAPASLHSPGPQAFAPGAPLHKGQGPFSKGTEDVEGDEQPDGPQAPPPGPGTLHQPHGVLEGDPSSQSTYSAVQSESIPQVPSQQQPSPFPQQLQPAAAGFAVSATPRPALVGPGGPGAGGVGSVGSLPGRAVVGDSLGPMFAPGGAPGLQASHQAFPASQLPASGLQHVAAGPFLPQPGVVPRGGGAPGAGLVGEAALGLSVHPGTHPGVTVQPHGGAPQQIPSSSFPLGHHAGFLPPHLSGDPGAGAYGLPGQGTARGLGPVGDPGRPEAAARDREGLHASGSDTLGALPGGPTSVPGRPAGGVGAEEQGLDAVPGWKEFAADGLRENMDVAKLAQHPELLKDPRIKSRFMRLLSRHEQIKNLFRMLGLDV
uniref:Uncharacterized protein n=1 Tax=Neospora caninum (strain Liverpool) TaxID=572307 RepID=A0A0F7UIQ3_NEOCL|nr:TPA: hypothetical protein BN1204_046340 [Neospora caninum Liverpool]